MSDKEPISPTKIEGGAKAKKARDSTSSGNHDGKGKASGKKKGHRKGKSGGKRKDLFVDLWGRPKHEIESELKDLIRRRTVAEQEFEAVQGERQRQIRIAQAIRGVIVDTKIFILLVTTLLVFNKQLVTYYCSYKFSKWIEIKKSIKICLCYFINKQ